jgi:hypothetical protein
MLNLFFYDLCLDFPTPTQGAGGPAWIVFLAAQNHFTQPKLFTRALFSLGQASPCLVSTISHEITGVPKRIAIHRAREMFSGCSMA